MTVRGLACLALAILASGCIQAQPRPAADPCGVPLEHFDATTSLWDELSNGTLHVPAGWPIGGQESPGLDAVVTTMAWRPDGKAVDEGQVSGEFTQVSEGKYVSPVVYKLTWNEANGTSTPWLSVTYPREETQENITTHVEWLFQAIGFPPDWPEWTAGFLATATDAGFGMSSYDNIRKVATPATPTARRYSLQWGGPDPTQTKLPHSLRSSDWVGPSLIDGPFGFAAALPWRSYFDLTSTDEVRIRVVSDGHVEGSVAVTNASRDRHALANETLAKHGVVVQNLTFAFDRVRGVSTSNLDCDST